MTGITPDLNGQNGDIAETTVVGETNFGYVSPNGIEGLEIFFPDGAFAKAPSIVPTVEGIDPTKAVASVSDVTQTGALLKVRNLSESFGLFSVSVGWIAAGN